MYFRVSGIRVGCPATWAALAAALMLPNSLPAARPASSGEDHTDWALSQAECAIPPLYRQFATNGTLLIDDRPDRRGESDSEPERTFVDGLMLRYCHQVTDVYDSQDSSDLPLQIRRNYRSEAWWADDALSPASYADRAFGPCWLSSLDCRLALTYREGRLAAATVVDEEGTLHRFLLNDPSGDFTCASLPTTEHQQEAASIQLLRRGREYTLRRKYGRTVRFASAETHAGEDPLTRTLYYRPIAAEDLRGMHVEYQYEAANTTLVPDRLVARNQVVRITRNAAGRVEQITDPVGNIIRYDYRSVTPGGDSALASMAHVDSGTRLPGTRYAYLQGSGTQRWHGEPREARTLEIAQISDPNNSTYYFEFSGTRPEALSGGVDGQPQDRPLSRIVLPGAWGDSRYTYLPAETGRVSVLARDAERDATREDFGGLRTLRSPSGQWPAWKLVVFEELALSVLRPSPDTFTAPVPGITQLDGTGYLTLQSYRLRYDPAASYALSSAINADGAKTTFAYTRTGAEPTGWPGFASQDLTAVTDALGQVKAFTFDPATRLHTRTLFESGHVSRREIDPLGRLLNFTVYASEADEAKNLPFSRTTYRYEDKRFPAFSTEKRVCQVGSADPAWVKDLVITYEADDNGRVRKETRDPDGLGLETERQYDLSGDLVRMENDEGVRRLLYDSCHHFLGAEWQNESGGFDRTTRLYFDARGNKTAEIGGSDGSTFYEYDDLNRPVKEITDSNGNNRFDPDVDPAAVTEYNAVGFATRKTDEEGLAFVRQYDPIGRVTFAYVRGQGSFHYRHGAGAGSVIFSGDRSFSTYVHSSAGWLQRVYDPLQRLIAEANSPSKEGSAILRKEWDADSNVVRESYSDGRVISRRYDVAGNLLEERDSAGSTIRNFYTSTGLKYRTIKDGKTSEFHFDTAGQLLNPPTEDEEASAKK